MECSLQTMAQPVGRIVQTKRDIDVCWGEKSRINRWIIRTIRLPKLRISDELNGVIPFLCGLQTELRSKSNQVIRTLHAVQRVGTGTLHTILQLQSVTPFHLLFIVIIGVHDDCCKGSIVTFTTFIPVIRDVILQELQGIVTTVSPEIRTYNHHFHRYCSGFYGLIVHLFNQVYVMNNRLFYLIQLCLLCLNSIICCPDKVGTCQIKSHQFRVIRALGLAKGEHIPSDISIECQRKKQS